MRPVSFSGSSATFWIHQNLTSVSSFPLAPILFTVQESVRVILASENEFTPNVHCDLCLITPELKSCYKKKFTSMTYIIATIGKMLLFQVNAQNSKQWMEPVWSIILLTWSDILTLKNCMLGANHKKKESVNNPWHYAKKKEVLLM